MRNPLDNDPYNRLLSWFADRSLAVVAFSGGVDSTLVLRVACEALGPARVIAVTGDSPSLARDDLAEAKAFAGELGVHHLVIETLEQDVEGYQANQGNRCFFCKDTLYRTLLDKLPSALADLGHKAKDSRVAIVDGTNFDDLSDHRPGQKAARDHGVKHPLVETELTKAAVREISYSLGLRSWDKPAMACLASRVAVGNRVTPRKLAMIEVAEKALIKLGFQGARVRYHDLSSASDDAGSALARIELNPDQLALAADRAVEISASMRDAGFAFVTLDLEGYRKGGRVTFAAPANGAHDGESKTVKLKL